MSLPSEPWITLQATDLNDYLVGTYALATRTAALAAGQADTFTNISVDVTNQIRSQVRSSLKNQVSMTPGTIPPDLKMHAMALIVERMQQRLANAGVTLGVEAIEKAADVARKYLDRVAEGKVVITAPPDPLIPDDQQRGAPMKVVRSSPRRYSYRQTRGLL